MSAEAHIAQKLIFITGKGGVGRTTIASALGLAFAEKGENTLLVQWSFQDFISGLWNCEPCGHKHSELQPNLHVMNFDPSEAMREYFVDHLNMKLLYTLVLQNKQVQKLLQSAPGLEELFFVGRLFWLAELAEQERNLKFDRIIVDAPATGHGAALFGIAKTISAFEMTGPLVDETRRVSALLSDPEKTAILTVCLPEELPVEETLEVLPRYAEEPGHMPRALILNRSARLPGSSVDQAGQPDFLFPSVQSEDLKAELRALHSDLRRRFEMEKRLEKDAGIPLISVPDFMIDDPEIGAEEIIRKISESAPFLNLLEARSSLV
ncbi:MAG: ArsA family ATPase [Leptospiraceae bacterium]|nr:ArsA family ATPase [Leptospiraceae bacterium]